MALTRDFKDAVMARAQRDPAFREGLLTEAIECFLGRDSATGKILLRDYINATIGFQQLAQVTGKKDTSLMRMLGPKGNPAAGNLFALMALLQKHEGGLQTPLGVLLSGEGQYAVPPGLVLHPPHDFR